MKRALMVIALWGLAPLMAQAVPVTFEFEGIVTLDTGVGVGLGTTATGSYTFESETVGLVIPGAAFYNGAVTDLTAELAGLTLGGPGSGGISVFDDDPGSGDTYLMSFSDGADFVASLTLNDPTGLFLSGTDLPLLPPTIPTGPGSTANLLLQTSPTSIVGVELTSLRVSASAPIPEPASGTLFGLGAIIAGMTVRRRLS